MHQSSVAGCKSHQRLRKRASRGQFLASPLVVDRRGNETIGRCGKVLIVVVLDVSWCFIVARDDCCDGSTSQYFSLTSDNVRLDP